MARFESGTKRLAAMLAIALFGTTPNASAQAPSSPAAATPADPARRAAARALIDQIMPPATRSQMMQTLLASTTANVRKGLENSPQFQQAMTGDPRVRVIFDRFMERQIKRSLDMVTASLPGMADAMAGAYARRFDMAQLLDLSAFFATPTGRAYAAASTTIMNDPDVAAWQQDLMRQSMNNVQADVGTLVKEIAALPPKGTKQ